MTFKQSLQYRAKALVAAVGSIVFAAFIALAVDPGTEKAIAAVVPAPGQAIFALVWAALLTAFVHRVPNTTPEPVAEPVAPVAEPTTETTMVKLTADSGGEYAGPAAH